jgi:hypothetical protein
MQINTAEALTTLSLVKQELASTSYDDDDEITACTAGVSAYWLERCGVFSLSTSNTFTETYSGNGSDVLYLRQQPATAITSLTIGCSPIPVSLSYGQAGYLLSDDGHSIILRCYEFCRERANVLVTYTAGYSVVPAIVQSAATRHTALWFKRRRSINEGSILAGAQGGSTTYLNNMVVTPDIEAVIRLYTRVGF